MLVPSEQHRKKNGSEFFFLMIFTYVERQNNCESLIHQNATCRSGTDNCPILMTLVAELGEVFTNSVDKDRTVPGFLLGSRL